MEALAENGEIMSARRIALAVLASIATAAALIPGTPAQAVAGDGWYRIVNDNSGLALQGKTDVTGVAVIQTYDTSSSDNGGYTSPYQDWLLVADGSNFRIRNAASSTWADLTVYSGVTSTTKPIILWTNSATNLDQVWQKIPVSGLINYYMLKNPKSGKCLAIPSASTDPGVQAIVWTCEPGNKEQQWYISDGR